MNQTERRRYLLTALLKEHPAYRNIPLPADTREQHLLLRGLINVRMPQETDPEFLAVQNAYLRREIERKGIVRLENLTPVQEGLYLWQGDITTLACDAIVNAANSGMTGCYVPNHRCIDNCIHTFAGVQLRLACAEIMQTHGYEEPAGQARLTSAYNLPCKYILHTVGPIVHGGVRQEDERLLASCYRSCLTLAEEHGLKSVAFCCISTGEFHFPNDRAAAIAVKTVKDYRSSTGSRIEVIFNVFKDLDKELYQQLLR